MLRARQFADILVGLAHRDEDSELLTNLKLQKLLYYAQGTFLREKSSPLFEEDLQAWRLGPVQPGLWREYSNLDRSPIPIEMVGDITCLDATYFGHAERIMKKFGKYSASYLVDLSHKDKPWLDVYDPAYERNVISKDAMQKYFKDHHIFDDDKGALDPTEYSDDFTKRLWSSVEEAETRPRMTADQFLAWIDAA